jgi:hypothetical protein
MAEDARDSLGHKQSRRCALQAQVKRRQLESPPYRNGTQRLGVESREDGRQAETNVCA